MSQNIGEAAAPPAEEALELMLIDFSTPKFFKARLFRPQPLKP